MGKKMLSICSQKSKLIDFFFIDTRATYSVLNIWLSQPPNQTIAVQGVLEEVLTKTFLQPLECRMVQTHLKRSFLNMPKCRSPLLGCDLLTKPNAEVTEQACAFQAMLLHQSREVLLELPEEII